MRIAVTTPTGHVGRHVLAMLVRAGLRPLALARDPARLDPAVRPHVDVAVVDLGDADAVVAATAGVDALYWVQPSGTGDDPVADHTRLGATAARAVTANGIGRTVFQSSVGAELRHGAGEIDGLARTEEQLDATGAAVLHLRCGFFTSNLLTVPLDSGVVPVVLPVDHRMPWVAPRDVAEVAVHRLLAGWTGRRVQAVHGPADLSWADATAVVAAVTGRPLRAERVTDEEMRGMLRGAGLGGPVVEGILGMSTGMRDGFVPEQPRDATTTTPTTLAAWAQDHLAENPCVDVDVHL
ncbi:NAD(P)H-binding protein [Pseudonocardia broussonetiae]|uniref:NAD(P)H-binding protein n=1 Tax=Pseudonocardia broussonetiae TaxID=2736640 RepID=A0A6M6JI21_9PSEU|nr:NAD(P)H-binding protein [Pseudonocardia broussonetiae]QJY46557.1 NAD(P)H-binding protein [Pseudonocardia broussonetiae]